MQHNNQSQMLNGGGGMNGGPMIDPAIRMRAQGRYRLGTPSPQHQQQMQQHQQQMGMMQGGMRHQVIKNKQ